MRQPVRAKENISNRQAANELRSQSVVSSINLRAQRPDTGTRAGRQAGMPCSAAMQDRRGARLSVQPAGRRFFWKSPACLCLWACARFEDCAGLRNAATVAPGNAVATCRCKKLSCSTFSPSFAGSYRTYVVLERAGPAPAGRPQQPSSPARMFSLGTSCTCDRSVGSVSGPAEPCHLWSGRADGKEELAHGGEKHSQALPRRTRLLVVRSFSRC
jgi:hypothetical protein